MAATVEGRQVAVQTDHRSASDIEAEPELSVLFAMARVLNARSHVTERGGSTDVRYVVPDEPPAVLREALVATGAVVERMHGAATSLEPLGPPNEDAAGMLADRAFRELARRAAARMGTRDLAIALRMLEDQTFAAPPERADEPAYWQRVLELAALTGELLRAKYPAHGRWVQTDRALVPFGFQLSSPASGSVTMLFPTNRAQRVIDDGADESLFKLLVAAEETMARPPDAATGRLMPSLRMRDAVELDEIVWQSLLPEGAPSELPIVVCGIDGESTFGMIRREALDRPSAEAFDIALANLAEEDVEVELMTVGGLALAVVSGSFYAAEKLLDRAFMQTLHDRLGSELLACAAPTRGLLLVTGAGEAYEISRFAALVRMRHDEAGGRAISASVLLVSAGEVAGFVRTGLERSPRADTGPIRADTSPETPTAPDDDHVKKPALWRRWLGRK
ncbi:MAG TPA: hypothetical protein VFQ53_32440 [Kofleriaceae bacterium]|nr:hypothetical protein [Kofleriaceae bacterium]